MKKVFDWHKWNAETYEKPKDIIRAFNSLGVCDKTIDSIRIIGFASHNARSAARRAQYEARAHIKLLTAEGFAYAEQTLVPCTIEPIGPMIFTFTDGSTFELLNHLRNILQPPSQEASRMSPEAKLLLVSSIKC